MPFPPYSNSYQEPSNIDYDLFVIDPGNEDTTLYQLRDCIKDALEVLEERITELERKMR